MSGHRVRSAHPDTIKRFLKNTARIVGEASGSRLRLSTQGIEGVGYLISEWPWSVVPLDDLDAFAADVIALGQDDCGAKGAPSKYLFEHVREDGSRGGGITLAFVPPREAGEDEEERFSFDGTTVGLIGQNARQAHQAYQLMIEMCRDFSKTTVQNQQASMQLIAQCYGLIRELMAANVAGHNEKIEISEAINESRGESKPDMFEVMMKAVGPEIVQRALALLVTETPTGGGGVQ